MKEKILSGAVGAVIGLANTIGQEGAKVFLMAMIGGLGGLVAKELYNKILKPLTIKTWNRLFKR